MKVSFDEWMSGRQWLGDKAPQEGFYGRYTEDQLERMEFLFSLGAMGFEGPDNIDKLDIDNNTKNLMLWAYNVGKRLNGKNNEKSK